MSEDSHDSEPVFTDRSHLEPKPETETEIYYSRLTAEDILFLRNIEEDFQSFMGVKL